MHQQKNNVIVLEMYLYRRTEDKLVLTNKTKVDLGHIDSARAAEFEEEAEQLLNPAAETVSITEARPRPPKEPCRWKERF